MKLRDCHLPFITTSTEDNQNQDYVDAQVLLMRDEPLPEDGSLTREQLIQQHRRDGGSAFFNPLIPLR
jgi:hypothetical protein